MNNNTNYILQINKHKSNEQYLLWLDIYKLSLILLYDNFVKDLDNNFTDKINITFDNFCKFVYKYSSKEIIDIM